RPAGAVPASVTIRKAAPLAPQTGTLNVQNGHAREYTYDLSRLLPVLTSGQSFGGEVTYTLKTVNITEAGYYDIDTAAISGTTLTLPVKAVESTTESSIGTIVVTISSKNFADVDATINVKRVNKQPVSIEGVTAQNGTYNGSTHNGYTGTPTASPYSGSFTTIYATADGTALSGPPTNAGNYIVTIAVPDKDETYAGSITLNFRIAKAQVLIIADDKEVVVGDAEPSFTYTITGLLGSDKLTTNPTLTTDAEMSDVGVYTITPGGADAGGNYDIDYGTGTLFVKAAGVEIQSKVESKELTDVPTGLAGTEFKTVESIKTELTKTLVTNTGYTETNAAHYDVTLQYSLDGGKSWIPATEDNFPMAGITIVLPYPEGTGRSTHDFVVSHMFTATSAKLGTVAGNTEQPPVTKLDNGIQVTLKGLSPVAIGYKATSSGGSGSGGGQVSYYSVKVDDSAHGKVTADRTSMYSGGTVTLSVTPDEGYVLDTLTVTDIQGSEIKLSAQGDGKHTFIMPSMAVTVKATFALLPDDKEKPCDGGTDCPSRGFTDLGTVGTWYHEAVDYVLRNNLMSGYGNGRFGPDDNLSRAQLAQILYNKEGRPQADRGVFTDVTTGWYASAVNWAAAQGIVAGVGGGRFAPDQPITRQDLAVMLWRYAGSPEPRKNELDFSDAGKVSTYAWRALCWANENGIVSGKGNGILDPRGKATRAEAAAMLMRYLSK
ncbi:S-layer homology domain-containing protein, partial [Acutalibacter sp. 1XD8-36]|uniref:S-layer homology domain-containing protein n=1 Tax=Acutalibacter sp. 1XD8-36 TaxID=2320852 RepID=UPI002617F962